MKKKFQKKHEIIKQHLKSEFNNSVIITGDPTGLFIVVEFKNIKFTKDIIDKLYKNKVIVHPIKEHSILNKIHDNKILLGYGNLTLENIKQGIKRIKQILG